MLFHCLQQELHPLSSFNQQSSRSVVNPQPSTSGTLPFGQHSLSFPPVFSTTGCTASPLFQLSSSTTFLPSTLSGQSAALPPRAPLISSSAVEVTPSPFQQVSSSLSLSHPTCSQPSSSQSSVHSYSTPSIFRPVLMSHPEDEILPFKVNVNLFIYYFNVMGLMLAASLLSTMKLNLVNYTNF